MTYSKDIISDSTNIIIFEYSDFFRQDMGLLILKRNKDDNKFELHLHNDYTNQAIAMVLSIEDFARMVDALEEYFNQRMQIVFDKVNL
jgi:hypothetical protein